MELGVALPTSARYASKKYKPPRAGNVHSS